jgi:hypothetical protein
MSGFGPFNPNQSIQNTGEFSSLDVTGDSTGVDVMTEGTAVVVDSTVAVVIGQSYPTIQGAVNYFQGKTCSNCTITVAAGTYVENLVVSGVNVGGDTEDLQILGDVRPIAGMTYITSTYAIANLQGTITPATYPLATYGAGAITLSNTGASDVTVTCAGTAVDFALAGVVAGDTCYVRNDAGAWILYTVLTAVGAVVTMTIPIVGTTTNVSTSITFLPNRKIIPTTVPSTAALIESNVTFKGFQTSFAASGATRYGLRVSHAKIHLDNFVALMCGAGIYADSESCINLDDYTAAASISILDSTVAGYFERATVRLTTPVFTDNGNNSLDMINSNVILTSPVIFNSNLLNRLGNNVQMTSGFMYLIAAFNGVIVQTRSSFHDIGSTFHMGNVGVTHTAIDVSNGGSFTSDGATATTISNAVLGISAVGSSIVDAPLLVYDTVTTAFTWDGSCSLRIMDSAGSGGAGAGDGFIMQTPIATSNIVHHIVGNEISSVLNSGVGAGEFLTAQYTVVAGANQEYSNPLTTLQAGYNMLCKGGRFNLALDADAGSAATCEFAVGTVASAGATATITGATELDVLNAVTSTGNVIIAPATTLVTGADLSTAGTAVAAGATLHLNCASAWVNATNINLNGYLTLNWTIVK